MTSDEHGRRTHRGFVYLVATLLALLIAVLINVWSIEIIPVIDPFIADYLTTMHGYGVVVWVIGVFALVVGIGLAMHLAGNAVIYTSKAIVWIGGKYRGNGHE